MLRRAARIEVGVSRQMYLSVLQDDVAIRVDQDGGVEPTLHEFAVAARLPRHLRVAKMEADAKMASGIEKWRRCVRRHGALEPMVGVGEVIVIMAWEE